jgi:type I restriction enzyme S subunit
MKLSKNKWKEVELGSIAVKLTDGAHNVPKELQEGLPMISARDIQNYKIDLSNPRYISKEDFIKESKRTNVQPNDILLTIVGTIGRCAIIPKDFPEFTLQRSVAVINTTEYPNYILTYFDSPNFQNQLLKKAIGTAQKGVYLKSLSNTKIVIPPLEEQKQIAALFQSIETAMEQVDGQEKNLKALQKSLVNGLLSKKPEFGNLLNSKNCQPTTFGEIAECDKKYPEHEKEVERFVGLEFIEADNFQLQGWGEIANGTTFSKRFVKGDVLFGKRRAYLKKVAVADFDGICSGDILVIRTKAKKMLQGLLSYYISADAFIQHAISTSAGSLSPRTKWKDLAELEVSIPDIKTQSTILEVLQQLDNTVNQLKQQKITLKNLKQKLLNEILG